MKKAKKKASPKASRKPQGKDEVRYGERILPRGGLQLLFKDGKAVWKYFPVRTGVRKATKKEAREIMKQAREGLGLVTIGKKRRKSA